MDVVQWWAHVLNSILIVSLLCFCFGRAVIPDDKNLRQHDYQTPSSDQADMVVETATRKYYGVDCPYACSCKYRETWLAVDCGGSGFRQIPLGLPSTMTNLTFDKNQLSSLVSVPYARLRSLTLSGNCLSFLNFHSLDALRDLEVLDLSDNDLKSVPTNVFSNLTHLVSLNMSRNFLRSIGDFTFYGLASLRTLDLSHNKLTAVAPNSFQHLTSLERLDLSHNQLVALKHEWFRCTVNLTMLSLHHNNLRSLSNVIFWTLRNLEELDLSHNDVSSVGFLSFKGLGQLRRLKLDHNRIPSLNSETLKPLHHLETADFSNNPLRSFDRLFTYSSSLETLYMGGMMNITVITRLSFEGLKNLKQLFLCNSTSLSSIKKNAFLPMTSLEYMDLSGNGITTIGSGTFDALVNLKALRLERNPWHCTCYLYWLLPWLGNNHHTNILGSSNTQCQTPPSLEGHTLLDALDHQLTCVNASIKHFSTKAMFQVGSSALLQCQAEGSPTPSITWITPQRYLFHWTTRVGNGSDILEHNSSRPFFNHPVAHGEDGQRLPDDDTQRFNMLQNGNLFIKELKRGDSGFYHCIAANPLNNHTAVIHLMLDYDSLMRTKVVSILVGIASSCGFLLLTLLGLLVETILSRCGIECPCGVISSSRKAQQIRRMLDNVEQYKRLQLDRLRENYTSQVQRIKENCVQQIEKLRESYSSQMERFRDIRDYGNQQIDRMRDNYYCQVQRVRDYSASQIDRLRENYLMQRNRIRKFSAHQLYKLRENYKLQQQHLNKILENLNIESCRNACGRTDSVMFEPEIVVDPVFMPAIAGLDTVVPHFMVGDITDSTSQLSAYFTPEDARSEVSAKDENPGNDATVKNESSDDKDEKEKMNTNENSSSSSDDETLKPEGSAENVNVDDIQYEEIPEEKENRDVKKAKEEDQAAGEKNNQGHKEKESNSKAENKKGQGQQAASSTPPPPKCEKIPEQHQLPHSTSRTSDISNETSV